jgi:hypothetical protein
VPGDDLGGRVGRAVVDHEHAPVDAGRRLLLGERVRTRSSESAWSSVQMTTSTSGTAGSVRAVACNVPSARETSTG